MNDSILSGTKKVLGIEEDYEAFDHDITLHINSVFSTINQLGIGPVDGFEIEDKSTTWSDFLGDNVRYNFIKTYMYLRVRLLFDPPTTSYLITAFEKQKDELEWRMSTLRETLTWSALIVPALSDLDGGSAVGE